MSFSPLPFEIFVTTNGRKTFQYCIQSIEEQNKFNIKVTIMKDKKWVDANNEMLGLCTSSFYLRVDDDMFLHSSVLKFILYGLKSIFLKTSDNNNVICYLFKLWEPHFGGVVNSIKLYNTALTKNIGFRCDSYGKIDKLFRADSEKNNLQLRQYKDILGIHACSSWEEQIDYYEKRGDSNRPNWDDYKESIIKERSLYTVSLFNQYITKDNILFELNQKYETFFYDFITEKDL